VSGSHGWSQRHLAGGRTLLSLAIVVGITGCDVTLDQAPQEAPVTCGFPGGTRLVFAGEAALSQLGLAEPGLGDEWGMVYVTADEVRISEGRPLRRAWCLVPDPPARWDSESSVGELPRDWVLPDPLPPLAQPPVKRGPPSVWECNGGQEEPAPSAAEWPGWEIAGAMQGEGYDQLQLAAFAGGVVAIHTPLMSCEATARYNDRDFISNTAYWLSEDGRSWEVLSVADAFGEPVWIATLYEASGGDLVAISALEWDQGVGDALPYRAWRSADGRTWEAIEDWSAPSGWVLRGADRWLLVPRFEESQAGAIPVWESRDGYDWKPSSIDLPEGARPTSASAASAGEGGFAILACPDDFLRDWGACHMLASADGETWDLSDPLSGWWWAVVSFGGEWRAVSWDRPDAQDREGHVLRVWRSADAMEWETLADLPRVPRQRSDGALVVGTSFVVAGADLLLSEWWMSSDSGATWEQDGPRGRDGPGATGVLASLTYEATTVLAGFMNDGGLIVFWVREE
jgi:hypothetical protein